MIGIYRDKENEEELIGGDVKIEGNTAYHECVGGEKVISI